MTDEAEVTKEAAAATKEVAKTIGKGIDATSDVGRFFDRVMGDLVTDAVGLLSDRLRFYRFERAVLLAEKTQKRLEEKGITNLRPVAPKVALPLIENATIENNDHLHTLWANLLASAMDAAGEDIERKFVSVLLDMSGEDASTLASIYDEWINSKYRKSQVVGGLRYGDSVDGTASYNAISVVTLYRLGLVAPSYVEFKTYEPGGDGPEGEYEAWRETVQAFGSLEVVVVTEFGEAFCKAVLD